MPHKVNVVSGSEEDSGMIGEVSAPCKSNVSFCSMALLQLSVVHSTPSHLVCVPDEVNVVSGSEEDSGVAGEEEEEHAVALNGALGV